MPRFKLTLEYDGGPFVGWQRQAAGLSVQGVVEAAATALDPSAGPVQGAGRTDAGVHATGQVAHLDLARDWDPFRLGEALNHHLRPHPVAVLSVEAAAPEFHARFDALRRRYRYRIVNRRAPLTLDRGKAWRIVADLSVDRMRAAAGHLLGRHDFTTFRAAQCQAQSPVKTLDCAEVSEEGGEIHLHFAARSFLHNQVRSFVGTLVQVGLGRWPPERVKWAMEARNRAECGPVAPPDGLFLTHVLYSVPPSA